MQKNVFEFLGRRIELWTHPEPDFLGRTIRANKTFYELDVLMQCRALYLPGTAIIDVGANIGNHAIFFGAVLNAPVYAFEAFAGSHALLELNIAANELDGQVMATCCAIGAADGCGSLSVGTPGNFGTAHVTFGAGDLTVRRLDGLAIPNPIGLIKIDVEGAELPVLLGAEELLRTWQPDLLIEAGTKAEFWTIADVLLRLGYAPRGRFAITPTYWFSAVDQTERMRRLLAARP